MKSIVSYKERGAGGNSKYRGNCSPKLIEDLIRQFKIEDISDYMRGSNTTGEVAAMLNIRSNTYDLNCGFDLVNDDIKERNQFIFWHPPYWDIIKYSGYQYGDKPLKNDLSHIVDYNEFIKLSNYCLAKQFASLKLNGRIAILMADVKKNRELYSMLLDINKLGTLEQILIKEQYNCQSDNKKYRNEDFIRITHEYLLILRKDQPYLLDYTISKKGRMDIRDSLKITWKDLVASVLENIGKKGSLERIYREIDGHKKCYSNNNWKEKIRQTLQIYTDIFKRVDRGVWELR